MKRSAQAHCPGDLTSGTGSLSTATGTLFNTPYSFHPRFEQGQAATPEELLAALQTYKPHLRRWSYVRGCVALFAGSALFGQQAQFQGSVPTGVASPTPLSLTLHDAIDRGLKTNLGLLLSGQASETTRR